MNRWEKNLEKLEEELREEIEAGKASRHIIPFCRLVLALGGVEVLEYITEQLNRYLRQEGYYVCRDRFEGIVLAILADFLYCAVKRSGAPTLVIRYGKEIEKEPT